MPNTNGNIYPLWMVSADDQVFARDDQGNLLGKSNVNFARDISLSEDGIVWLLSNTPDPDGGGKIFWGTGDGNWNEINTKAPGAVRIAGAGPSTCLYIAPDQSIWNINTNGESKQIYNSSPVYDLDTGGGFTWALMAPQPGKQPALYYTSFGVSPLEWHPFEGSPSPANFSVAYNACCYGVVNNNVVFFSSDGKTSNPYGTGAGNQALRVSFKNWMALVSTRASEKGNEVMLWKDVNGGTYYDAGFTAARVASSYYLAS
jgi:hypothetical protein